MFRATAPGVQGGQYFGPAYLESEQQLSVVAGYIIMAAAMAEKATQSIKELKGEKTGSVIFLRAGEVVRRAIESAGES